ncbi:MAG: hypothetical protein U0992_21055 [Planctomycetaceae bacterium]
MAMAALRPRGVWPTVLLLTALAALAGCNRTFYREAADYEVRVLVDEKSHDPRWDLQNFSIEIDPRSRYAITHDPDFPPMPDDDPTSHQLMVQVDGKRGYSGWNDYGEMYDLENPWWREAIGQYAPLTEDGKVLLTLDNSVRIARLHSPDFQDQLETIYLSALDVSTERFRFDTQFAGGTGFGYTHIGPRRGVESDRLSLNSAAQTSRLLSSGGELLISFANNTVWEFLGPNRGLTTSLLTFNLVQPLLQNGGRAVALERLTLAERTLLANLRAMGSIDRGFTGPSCLELPVQADLNDAAVSLAPVSRGSLVRAPAVLRGWEMPPGLAADLRAGEEEAPAVDSLAAGSPTSAAISGCCSRCSRFTTSKPVWCSFAHSPCWA